MALYLGLSLLAVLLAIPASGEASVEILIITAIGLLIAHLLAFAVSSRLVTQGRLDAHARGIAAAQVLGGLAVVVLVSVPVLLFDAPTGVRVAEFVLLAFVAAVGYLAARQAEVSRTRAAVYAGVVILLALLVVVVKGVAGH